MTTNEMDAEALVLDQTYFALGAEGFSAFYGQLDNPPSPTATCSSVAPPAAVRCS